MQQYIDNTTISTLTILLLEPIRLLLAPNRPQSTFSIPDFLPDLNASASV